MKKIFKLVKEKNSFQIHWEKKSVKEIIEDRADGTKKTSIEIEGYASTKDKDRGNDIVEPKAFEEALATYMTNPIVLLQHKHDKPIGVVTEARIDNKGLYIKANISQNTDGAMDAIKDGVLRTFSIGYGVKEGDYEINEFIDDNGNADYTTTIKKLELYEISVVSVPMNAYALMKSIEDCFEVEDVEDDEVFDKNENQENNNEEVENQQNSEDKISEESQEEETENSEETEETLSGNISFIQKDNETENSEETVENNENTEDVETVEETVEEKIEETTVETEQKEVAENANIEETETEESSENTSESEVNNGETNIIEEKSMEVSSQKNLYNEKALDEVIEKKLSAKLLESQKAVDNLNNELDKVKNVLKSAIQVIGEMDGALRNTVIKTGATYSQVAKKQTAWSDVIAKAKSSI